MHVPIQLGTEVFTVTTLCVKAELSRAANVVWHVTESKVKTNTCLCVGNVISRDTRTNESPAETPAETLAETSTKTSTGTSLQNLIYLTRGTFRPYALVHCAQHTNLIVGYRQSN